MKATTIRAKVENHDFYFYFFQKERFLVHLQPHPADDQAEAQSLLQRWEAQNGCHARQNHSRTFARTAYTRWSRRRQLRDRKGVKWGGKGYGRDREAAGWRVLDLIPSSNSPSGSFSPFTCPFEEWEAYKREKGFSIPTSLMKPFDQPPPLLDTVPPSVAGAGGRV